MRVSSYNFKALLTSTAVSHPSHGYPARAIGWPAVSAPHLERADRMNRWDDKEAEAGAPPFKPLTREEAQALRAQEPPLSPWWVLGVQVAVGVVTALLAAWVTGRQEVAWSVLYGAATVVVPGALMARGMTSPISSASPAASAVSVLLWASVKILVSVVMLVIASRVVQPLVWPALLLGLVLCMKVYLVVLIWRRRRSG
jgi:ATP synthase protein I